MDEPRFTNIWLRTTKPTKPYILITDLRMFFNLRSNINLINDPQKKKKTPDGSEVQPRQRTLPSHLDDSVVLCPMPQYRDTASSSTANVAAYRCMQLGKEIINAMKVELDDRFTDNNVELWVAFQALSPVNDTTKFLDAYLLVPLLEYAFTIPCFRKILGDDFDDAIEDMQSECRVFKDALLEEYDKFDKDETLLFTEKFLYYCERHDSTMRVIKVLFQVAITAGYSTSTAECVFSARARIDTPSRRRLTPYKQGNLTLLHFESGLTSKITFEDFVAVWVKLKPRRLRL